MGNWLSSIVHFAASFQGRRRKGKGGGGGGERGKGGEGRGKGGEGRGKGGGRECAYVFDDAPTCTSVPAPQDPLDEVGPYCNLHFDLFDVSIQQIY